MDKMITERQSQILNAIIEEYIHTAMPVSSGTVFATGFFGVSCPTIRNEMADLTHQGYLNQPHTSAGRMPTEQGYRFFVDAFIEKRRIKPNRKKVKRSGRAQDIAEKISSQTKDLFVFVNENGEVKYLGLKTVLNNPEFRTRAAVLSMIDELERFESYIDSVITNISEEIDIFIGSENPFFESCEYSMMTSGFNDGLVAFIGPMRMNYQKNLWLLESLVRQ